MDTSLNSIFILRITFLLVLCISYTQQSNIHHADNGVKDSSAYFFYQRPKYPRDCDEVFQECSASQNVSGVYLIKPDGFLEAFEVFCDHSSNSGGWMVVQRRNDGSLNFNRGWNEYKDGFGFLSSEFWLGNEKLSFILNQKKYELRIQLVTSDVSDLHLTYDDFRISDGWGKYSLVSVGTYSGNADSHLSWCPANMTFGNCSCQATCEDPRNENGCHNTCKEEYACVCKEGYLLRGNDCIRAQDCHCFVQGAGVIQNGESYINPDCSRRCSCNGNQLTCESYQCGIGATCIEVEGAYQCECDDGFVRDGRNCVLAADCKTLYDSGVTTNGVYIIKPSGWSGSGFQVYCEMESNGGGWTVFQRRMDGTVDFYRNWASYKQGFGSLTHEFWLGNDKIHAITNQKTYQLRVDAINSQGTSIFNTYSTFRINDENDKYRLSLGSQSGNTGGDALNWNRNQPFSAYDQDNDDTSSYNCAERHRGGWWYHFYSGHDLYCYNWRSGSIYCYCSDSNLNGDYQQSGVQSVFFRDNNSGQHCGVTRSEMKLRPV